MGSEWHHCTLGDIASQGGNGFVDGPFGSNLPASCYTAEGVPVIRGSNLTLGLGRFVDNSFVYVSEETAARLARSLCRSKDIVFTKKGTLGQTGLVPEDGFEKYLISSNQMKLTVNTDIADPLFVYYYVSSPASVEKILRDSESTGVPKINLTYLRNFPVSLPDLLEQKSIARILGSLDDKIELNRQMNATLEAMAQALFKSWFVDFDPVLDNALAAGNPIPDELQQKAERRAALGAKRKSLPAALQQQFPSRFVFSEELGWIPEGWEVSTVGNEFDVTMGQSPPGDTYNEMGDGMPFFQGRADFGFRYPANRVYCTAPKRLASKGDTLVSVRAPVGEVNMAAENCCIGRGVSASRHKSGSRSFTYYAMLQLREHFKVYEAEGTVFGSINQKDFKALPQVKAPGGLVVAFESYSRSFDGKVELTTESILGLTMLRDTLLPKLLSGELRIPDAEQLLEQV